MEFLVDEARLVDLEGATSDAAPGCCCRLFGASSSLRGDGALDWSPGVDERASPCLESAMASGGRANRLGAGDRPRHGEKASHKQARAVARADCERKSPSGRDIKAA